MDVRKVKRLIELLEESQCTELEIKEGEETIRISRAGPIATYVQPLHANPIPTSAPQTHTQSEATHAEPVKAKAKGHEVKSPMVGTLYLTPSPEANNFVSIGQTVKAGDTLCLIEAMKMFNPIEADTAGVIADILVNNGEPIEYGQLLFIIQ